MLAYIKNYALIMTVKQFNCFQRCSAYQTKTMMLSAISVLLLFFISICSASEIYILAIQQVNKSLTIGKYTDYTITSCVMRCKNNKKCAGIAFSELPTSKEKETFDCYLLQSKMVGEPEETQSQDASERNKMIGIREVRSGFESFCNIFVIFFLLACFCWHIYGYFSSILLKEHFSGWHSFSSKIQVHHSTFFCEIIVHCRTFF